jgi:isocitrate dehydrogenase
MLVDHWRARYFAPGKGTATHAQIVELLAGFDKAGLDFIKTEGLYNFDETPGFSA